MKSLTERFAAWIANRCTQTATYRFQGTEIRFNLDWRAVEAEVQSSIGTKLPLKGGFLARGWYGLLMPSFAYAGHQASYIVIYPGNWRRRMYFASGKRVSHEDLNPCDVLAHVLAHESRHIKQGVRGYGVKSMIVFPGLFLAPVVGIVCLVLLPFGVIPWWVPVSIVLYYYLALWMYFNDRREIDARKYARENGVEWKKFIAIAP